MITFLQILVFLAYIFYIIETVGRRKLTSISGSAYHLQGQKRWYFFLFLLSIAVLNLFQPMGLYGFVASAGLIFTGITVEYRRSWGTAFHGAGVGVAIAISFLGLLILHSLVFPLVLAAVVALILYVWGNRKRFVWNVEIALFAIILTAYFFI